MNRSDPPDSAADPQTALRAWLTVNPLGVRVPVHAGQSLIEAAQAAGLELPRSCRNGTCRACRCVLTQGRVTYRVEWPGLSLDEREAGEILPCVAIPESDVSITQPLARRQSV